MLMSMWRRQGVPEEEYEVLNEVVVSRGANPFLTKIEVYEHNTLITKASCETCAYYCAGASLHPLYCSGTVPAWMKNGLHTPPTRSLGWVAHRPFGCCAAAWSRLAAAC